MVCVLLNFNYTTRGSFGRVGLLRFTDTIIGGLLAMAGLPKVSKELQWDFADAAIGERLETAALRKAFRKFKWDFTDAVIGQLLVTAAPRRVSKALGFS